MEDVAAGGRPASGEGGGGEAAEAEGGGGDSTYAESGENVAAARHVLALSERLDIPIIKVVHLSVSKKEMQNRALGRKRMDDTPETLERRYQFYIDHVQPSVELLKAQLGSKVAALIDAHQPEYRNDGSLDLEQSVRNVANSVLMALGVSRHILESLDEQSLLR